MARTNSCDSLNGNLILGCNNNIGGLKRAFALEKNRISSTTLNSPTQEISAITTVASAKFYEFEFSKGAANYVETETTDLATGRTIWEQVFTLNLNRREKTKRDQLLLMSKGKDMCWLVQDNNDVWWLLGENFGTNLMTNVGGSGSNKTDPNQYVLTFKGEEALPANTVLNATAITVINV